MNGSFLRAVLVVALVAVAAVFYACTFVVSQTQSAIVLRLGAVRAVKTAPGLYFKWFAPIETVTASVSRETGPAQCAEQNELKERIETALSQLSEDHRQVVILHEMHGLTYSECAEALGVPVGTVKSRLFNAFRRLRSSLGGYVLGEENLFPGAATETS